MDKFISLFNKYPWVAIVILMHWLITGAIVIYAAGSVDVTLVMGLSFLATVIYAYFGFKVPRG